MLLGAGSYLGKGFLMMGYKHCFAHPAHPLPASSPPDALLDVGQFLCLDGGRGSAGLSLPWWGQMVGDSGTSHSWQEEQVPHLSCPSFMLLDERMAQCGVV